MPWLCGYCSLWSPSACQFCATCGRSGKGRLCGKCKATVPATAVYCPGCGGNQFRESALKRLPLRRSTRAGIVVVGLLGSSLAFWLLQPVFAALWHWTLGALLYAFSAFLAFWFVTALLPDGPRQVIRRIAWGLLRFSGRILTNLAR